jgi:hypothetical protein
MSAPSYTKAQLLQMNNSESMGVNWITKINTINEGTLAKIYPTWAAGLAGRYYVALPATIQITNAVRLQYNIM